MSTPLQPLGDYVVAQAEEAQSKTKSGLYIPDSAQKKPKTAKIVAVGPLVKQVKVGDRIVYKDFGATPVTHDDAEYMLVEEKDILATVK